MRIRFAKLTLLLLDLPFSFSFFLTCLLTFFFSFSFSFYISISLNTLLQTLIRLTFKTEGTSFTSFKGTTSPSELITFVWLTLSVWIKAKISSSNSNSASCSSFGKAKGRVEREDVFDTIRDWEVPSDGEGESEKAAEMSLLRFWDLERLAEWWESILVLADRFERWSRGDGAFGREEWPFGFEVDLTSDSILFCSIVCCSLLQSEREEVIRYHTGVTWTILLSHNDGR